MLKKIESIRKKPVEVRNRYAFWYALGFTAVIAVFWLASVPAKFSVLTNVEAPIENERVQGGLSRSFSDLRASLSGGVETFNEIKEEAQTVGGEEDEYSEVIDFDTFFSSSTLAEPEVVSSEKQVLIATSAPSIHNSDNE